MTLKNLKTRFTVRNWKLEDDVLIGRGLEMAEKWEKDFEKIVQNLAEGTRC